MAEKITRREFVIRSAGAAVAAGSGALLPAQAQNVVTNADAARLSLRMAIRKPK
jgi:hypothetical protein